MRWGQDAADHVLAAGCGAPFLLQLFGDAAWRVAAPTEADFVMIEAGRR